MNLHELIEKMTSGEIPAVAMASGGIVLLLLWLKAVRGFFKTMFLLIAVVLLAGAAWCHFHQRLN